MSKLKVNIRLKLIREDRGYTQEQFAELLEVSTSGYKKIESGEVRIGIDKIQTLHKKLGISADYLLFDENTEFAEAWEKTINLPEEEKWKMFLRLYAYLIRKTTDDSYMETAMETVDNIVKRIPK